MKRHLLALATCAFLSKLAFAAEPAEVSLVLFDQGTPVADAEIRVDGAAVGRTSSDGAALLKLEPGARTLKVLRAGTEVLSVELNLVEDENAELIATLYPDAAPSLFIESTHAAGAAASTQPTEAGPPGTLTGRVFNAEDGKPVAGARVYVSGTPIDIVTDAEGRFSVPVSAGTYSLSVLAPRFSSRSFEGVEIASEQTTEQAIELTPAGVELPEFVVLEPFIEGSLASFVEERRTSSAVTDILGAEQISRAGDSDAAGALKRVTGLTLVDGKFVYVRGLGERYSSTLLNGAQIPSPDPTRRVVPLDLFPTELLSGILVQKTYTADMPGEFGGGTIQLRTRGVPESFLLRASGTLGYADGTTGKDGLRYDGGNRDWTGRGSGVRSAPEGLLDGPLSSLTPQQREDAVDQIAAQGYNTREARIDPNYSGSVAIGDDFQFSGGDWSLGYIASVRHSHSWDTRDELRQNIGGVADNLRVTRSIARRSTDRSIDSSTFLALGFKAFEQHEVTANFMQVRQTTDQTAIDEFEEEGDSERRYELEWVENELEAVQLSGEHSLPSLLGMVLSWQYTDSTAQRLAPNTREYRFARNPATGLFVFEFSNQQRWESLVDDATELQLDLRFPIEFSEAHRLEVLAGASRLEKTRDSDIRRFTLRPSGNTRVEDLELLFNPEVLRGADLREAGQPTDSYEATVDLDAEYLGLDYQLGSLRLNAGARRESIFQRVVNVAPFSPGAAEQVGEVISDDLLPAGSLTWSYSDKAQLRFGYSKTLSRPDIREQSPANYIDPQLDVRVIGNPDLVQTEIENLDLRWEYYFSSTESFSVALFQKDFTSPIELINIPGTEVLLTLANANAATNRGVEFDFYKSLGSVGNLGFMPDFARSWPWADIYLGANYAYIDSEIDLGEDSGNVTNTVRALQGQSPYVANLSLSYLPAEGSTEAQLSYNVFGERITRVGINGFPDVYEEPFDQLDLTLSTALPWEGWKFKLRLRNLLDPTSKLTVGGLSSREFKKGREAAVSIEWKF